MPSLRIAFFGTPGFAVPTLDALLGSQHQVVGVVTQPDRPRGRGQKVTDAPIKARALAAGVPVLQPPRLARDQFEETFASLDADLGVVAAYGKLLPEWLLAAPRLGMINVHASLLPKHRGAAPVHRAVIAGDAETGVTIMRVVKALDAGPMIATVTRPIGPDETSDAVEHGLAALGAALLLDTVDRLAEGRITEVAQHDEDATYAPRLTKNEGLIDWQQPAAALHNQIRGLHPWPHAFTHLAGTRIILHRSQVGAPEGGDAEPGTVLSAADSIRVAAEAGTTLDLTHLQPEGRRVMTAREFVAGRPVPPGTRFG